MSKLVGFVVYHIPNLTCINVVMSYHYAHISSFIDCSLLLWYDAVFFMELKILLLLEWCWIAPFQIYIILWWSLWMFIKFGFLNSL